MNTYIFSKFIIMGIPSYFSYIIKNYPNIIRNLQHFINNDSVVLNNLFMDCNSIIYDAVRIIEKESPNLSASDFENAIIDNVIFNIQKYIHSVKPTNSVFIAFDGVAPFAKMEQQRTRRYKSSYMNTINNSPTKSSWNTSAITPGTQFMNTLSKRIRYAFQHTESKYNIKKFVISCSDEYGEGEHKLMECIRSSNLHNETVALYGLDADLIMLAIFHLKYTRNIYVFREAPEFIKNSIPVNVQGGLFDLYFLDIDTLANSIVIEMNCIAVDKHRVYDYVFLCFLLGNDFLPHFPAMNIRTHGIDALMNIYRLYIGNNPERFLISKNNKIQWKNVSLFISEIAKSEHQFLINEYFARDKFDKRNWLCTTPQERDDYILNLPVIHRADEKYIYPDEKGWEKRYYKTLFHEDHSPDFIKKLSNNYLEGLEWVFKYYSSGCPDWKWKYNYHYPPLFKDLCKYIPHFEIDFISNNNEAKTFSPELQLSYVLPISQLDLLPKPICEFLKKNYLEYYPEKYEFQWAFCRYFWESHPLLPTIPIELLNQWDLQFRMCIKN